MSLASKLIQFLHVFWVLLVSPYLVQNYVPKSAIPPVYMPFLSAFYSLDWNFTFCTVPYLTLHHVEYALISTMYANPDLRTILLHIHILEQYNISIDILAGNNTLILASSLFGCKRTTRILHTVTHAFYVLPCMIYTCIKHSRIRRLRYRYSLSACALKYCKL